MRWLGAVRCPPYGTYSSSTSHRDLCAGCALYAAPRKTALIVVRPATGTATAELLKCHQLTDNSRYIHHIVTSSLSAVLRPQVAPTVADSNTIKKEKGNGADADGGLVSLLLPLSALDQHDFCCPSTSVSAVSVHCEARFLKLGH